MILKCECKNEEQDRLYGKGIRVMNETKNSPDGGHRYYYRCTVCGKEKLK